MNSSDTSELAVRGRNMLSIARDSVAESARSVYEKSTNKLQFDLTRLQYLVDKSEGFTPGLAVEICHILKWLAVELSDNAETLEGELTRLRTLTEAAVILAKGRENLES